MPHRSIINPPIVNMTTATTNIIISSTGMIEPIPVHQKFCGQKRKLHRSALFSEIEVAFPEVLN